MAVNGNDHNEFRQCVRCYQAFTSVQCVTSLFMLFVEEDSEGFGLKVTCNLCVRKNRINIECEGAKSGQEQQAQKMGFLSNSRLPAVYTGTNVLVRVPDLHLGRLAPEMSQQSSLVSTLLGFICWAPRKAYLSGCMLAMNSQLLTTTSSRHTMCPQVHYLFGQPQ